MKINILAKYYFLNIYILATVVLTLGSMSILGCTTLETKFIEPV